MSEESSILQFFNYLSTSSDKFSIFDSILDIFLSSSKKVSSELSKIIPGKLTTKEVSCYFIFSINN